MYEFDGFNNNITAQFLYTKRFIVSGETHDGHVLDAYNIHAVSGPWQRTLQVNNELIDVDNR